MFCKNVTKKKVIIKINCIASFAQGIYLAREKVTNEFTALQVEFKNEKLVWEWGFIFRMEGPDTKPFATCLVYTCGDETEEVLELNYLGLDHGLPTVEEAKEAIITALKMKI